MSCILARKNALGNGFSNRAVSDLSTDIPSEMQTVQLETANRLLAAAGLVRLLERNTIWLHAAPCFIMQLAARIL